MRDFTLADMGHGTVVIFNSDRARSLAAVKLGSQYLGRHWSLTISTAEASTLMRMARRLGLTYHRER